MSPLLTPEVVQIERELDALLASREPGRILGMRSPTQRAWPECIERGGRRFRLAWCPSELEIRECLDEVETDPNLNVVVLTPLESTSLGGDIAARLPRGRLAQSDRWDVLRGAFRVRDVDSRLRSQRWLADLLIERAPVGGYAPAAGGMLDLDTAWNALQEQVLGLPAGRTDAAALLEWTRDLAGVELFAGLDAVARREVTDRLTSAGGPGVGIILNAVAAGRGEDALPIGLVCGVVFGEAEPRPELREAAVRLEPLVGGTRVAPEAGQALAAAARRVLARISMEDPPAARVVQITATALLRDVRAESAAALSPALDMGLEARMKDAAASLSVAAISGTGEDAVRAWNRTAEVTAHDRSKDQRARVDRLIMAARLACWLAAPRPSPTQTMAEAAANYAGESGFADRARHALQAGDRIPEVAAAYATLREIAAIRREEENRAFADVVRAWNAGGTWGTDPLPVERILDLIVVPLARSVPVLVLVLDGLSFATWRALAESLPRLGWSEYCPKGRTAPPTAIAVLPSVTAVSRTSLLCGTITRGDQTTEKKGFAEHPGLVGVSAAGSPPVLFHKADLGPGPELPATLREKIAAPGQRVVGVVHNAVDAQLSGSDQIELTWSAEALRQVDALLRLARDSGRAVVVTGDHGHIIEDGDGSRSDGTRQRWRAPGPPEEGEILLTGGRVLSPDDGQSVVVAWSERLRHASSRAGSHGGTSPQEVLVPIAVLGAGIALPGWELAPPAEPPWWQGKIEGQRLTASPLPAITAVRSPARQRPVDTRQAALFTSAPSPELHEHAPAPSWVAALFGSETYVAQRRLAGRGVPRDEEVQSLLCALTARGGRLSRTSLAQSLSVPAFRIPGLVNTARRLLNLDQAQVLVMDGDEVVLDERLLRVQFDLGSGL